MERERKLAELATRQYGIASRDQLLGAGLTARMIERRIQSGRLQRLYRGVYAVGHRPVTLRSRWMAAVLAAGPGAVLSHRSAAALWSLTRFRSAQVDVTVLDARRRTRRPDLVIHVGRLRPDERTEQLRIAVTTVARTLLDLAELVDRRSLERAFGEAERRGLLKLAELEHVCAGAGGRRGLKPLQRLMGEGERLRGRTPLEDRVLELCRKYELPIPQTNVIVLGREVDCFWPDQKLMVEADGFEFHGHRAAFENDRVRDAEMQVAGYRVIRLTHLRLNKEPAKVAAELRHLLRRRG